MLVNLNRAPVAAGRSGRAGRQTDTHTPTDRLTGRPPTELVICIVCIVACPGPQRSLHAFVYYSALQRVTESTTVKVGTCSEQCAYHMHFARRVYWFTV